MKMRLTNPQVIPYGGMFNINRPDLGVVGRGLQFSNLLNSVKQWRIANNYPIGVAFEEEVEQAACVAYPNECEALDGPNMRKRSLTLSDVVTGTKVMLRFKSAGSPLVSPEVANERAATCSNCPFNTTFAKPCSGICAELKNIVTDITGARGTSKDHLLNSCNICSCFLQASVWLPLSVQVPPLSEDQKEKFESVPHCWKKASLMTQEQS